jgi:hypothetical protein
VTAADRFERYYLEKMWALVPSVHRTRDGLASPPDVLRSIVAIIANTAAVLRRSQDRVWDDQFIDLCDDWAVPYLGDLVATRMVSALDTRTRRIDVAKTIYYRRRKGTPAVLAELLVDITAWDGALVEELRRLARHRHGLDPKPAGRLGRITGTPPGGWADLRAPRGGELDAGPFGEWSHRPDMRRFHGGADGRYGIPKLGFHLYRLTPTTIAGVTPVVHAADPRAFTVDPSGRSVPLFQRKTRPSFTTGTTPTWRAPREYEVAAPMTCRGLADAQFVITESRLAPLGLPASALADLATLAGIRFRDESRLRLRIAAMPSAAALTPANVDAIVAATLVPDCGRAVLLIPGVDASGASNPSFAVAAGTPVPPTATYGADLSTWRAGLASPPHAQLLVDPALGRIQFPIGAPAAVTTSYTIASLGPIGAGVWSRSGLAAVSSPADIVGVGVPLDGTVVVPAGVKEIDNNSTYASIASQPAVANLTLQAGDHCRPFVELAGDWTLTGVVDATTGAAATLVLDGLWLGGAGTLVLAGTFASVTLRNLTLDPGGGSDPNGAAISEVALAIGASVESLVIERCITGPIGTQGSGEVETLTISDSIVQAVAGSAIAFTSGTANLARTTVLGTSTFHRLDATDSVFADGVDVADTQHGCFRFSAAPAGSRLPHPFESVSFDDPSGLFLSTTFGAPAYACLSAIAPATIARGAESGSEMGAYSSQLVPIKLDSLATKVDEYMPFGLVPMFIPET